MGMTTVLNAAGVDKERFVDYTDKNPATYKVKTSEQGICIIDTNQCKVCITIRITNPFNC